MIQCLALRNTTQTVISDPSLTTMIQIIESVQCTNHGLRCSNLTGTVHCSTHGVVLRLVFSDLAFGPICNIFTRVDKGLNCSFAHNWQMTLFLPSCGHSSTL